MAYKVEAGNLLETPTLPVLNRELSRVEKDANPSDPIPIESPALYLSVTVSENGEDWFEPPMGLEPGQIFYARVSIRYPTSHAWKAWAHFYYISPGGVSYDEGEQESEWMNVFPSFRDTAYLAWHATAPSEYGFWKARFEVRTNRNFFGIWIGGEEGVIEEDILKILKPGEVPPPPQPVPPEEKALQWAFLLGGAGAGALGGFASGGRKAIWVPAGIAVGTGMGYIVYKIYEALK